MGSFFSGPKPQESKSGNKAYGTILGNYAPMMGYGTMGGSAIANLLGLAPTSVMIDRAHDGIDGNKHGANDIYHVSSIPGQSSGGSGGGSGASSQVDALTNWSNSGGMQFLRDQGNNQIDSNQSAKGLLKSGSTLKALEKYGQGLGSTYLNQYMDNLFKFSNLGLGAGNLISGAGQFSEGTGAQPAGAGKQMIGQLANAAVSAAVASDSRLKDNIVEIGVRPDGLMEVEFDYNQNSLLNLPKGRFRGVLAEEVAAKRPSGLGPEIKGYLTVKDEDLLPKKVN